MKISFNVLVAIAVYLPDLLTLLLWLTQQRFFSLPFHLKLVGFTQTNIALVNQYCYIVLSIEIFIINQIKMIYFPQVRPGRDPFWLCEWCVLGCYFLLRVRSSDPEIV